MDDVQLASVAKALGHPARMHIMRLLAREQECRGSELFSDLPLAQSTISQHLAVLREAGIVSAHSVGAASVYCIDPEIVRSFCSELSAIVASTPACSIHDEECR